MRRNHTLDGIAKPCIRLAAILGLVWIAHCPAQAAETPGTPPTARAFHYSGVVCDQTASPKAGVKVAVIGANQVAVTDANGAFDVKGTMPADADKDGFRTESEIFPLIELSADKFEPVTFRPDSLTQTDLALTIWAFAEPKEGDRVDQARWAYIFRRGFPGGSPEAERWLPSDKALIAGAGDGYNKDWWGGCKGIGNEISGLMWESPKHIASTEIEFVDGTGTIPKEGEISAAFRYIGTVADDDWWNTGNTPVDNTGLRFPGVVTSPAAEALSKTFSVAPATDRVMLFHKGLPGQDAKKVAAVSYKDMARFTLHAYDDAKWMKPLDIDIEWGFQAGSQRQSWDGYMESYQGYVTDIQPLGSGSGGVVMTGQRHWKDQPGLAQRRGIRVRVWMETNTGQEMKTLEGGDRTVVTLWTKAGNVSFAPSDLEKGPILIPSVGIYVSKRDSNLTAAQFQKQLAAGGKKTIRQRVREHRDLNWETAMKARFPDTTLPPIPAAPAANPPVGMEINVPEDQLNAQWRYSAAKLAEKAHKQPDGTCIVDVLYGNSSIAAESYQLIRVYDFLGLHDLAKASLNLWLLPTKPVVPKGNLLRRDTQSNCEWNGNANIQAAAWLHYQLTHDDAWVKDVMPELQASYDYAQQLRKDWSGTFPKSVWAAGLIAPLVPPLVKSHRALYVHDAFTWEGLAGVANLASVADPEHGRAMQQEVGEYRRDIRRAANRSVALTPVIQVEDGTYRRYMPAGPYMRGRFAVKPIEATANGLQLCRKGIFAPDEPAVQETLDVVEDINAICPNSNAAKSAEPWFDQSGYSTQCGIEPQSYVHFLAGDAPLAIRATYAMYAADIAPAGQYRFFEYPNNKGNPNKVFEEAAFMERVRMLLIMEQGDTLWLARSAPREWMEQGKTISVKNAPTFFGTAGYEIVSDVDHGKISASVTMPSRNPPKEVCLSLRHPKSAPIKSVTVNGKPWTDFDPGKEMVRLHGLKDTAAVDVRYAQ